MASISEPVEQWTPRQDYLRDDDYFMALALLTGQRSTHPDKQVGACIVKDNKVIAVGYHQVVKEGADVQQGRPPTESEDQVEYHAETDAIIKGADVHGCTMFVTEFPCCQCMKVIIQAGIKSVIYLSNNPIEETNKTNSSKKMLMVETNYKKYQPQRDDIVIKCTQEETKQPTKKQKKDSTLMMADSDYFMAVALLTAQRSRDPNTQEGACIARDNEKVISVGHNQMPNDNFDTYTWDRDLTKDNKHFYVCHAELNAILSSTEVRGCTIYVTLFPCSHCAKLIVGKEVETVVYWSDKYGHREDAKKAKKILGNTHKPYEPDEETLVIFLDDRCSKQHRMKNPKPGERCI